MKQIIQCKCRKTFMGLEGKEDTCPDCLRELIQGTATTPVRNSQLKVLDDDTLIAKRARLIGLVNADKDETFRETLSLLLEVERELTLREE